MQAYLDKVLSLDEYRAPKATLIQDKQALSQSSKFGACSVALGWRLCFV